MRKIMVLGVLGVAGCVNPTQQYTDAMNTYVGAPADNLVRQIGLPDLDQTVMGQHVLTWDRNGTIAVGNRIAPVSCKLRFTLDARDIVTGWQSDGSLAGCQPYMRKLSELHA